MTDIVLEADGTVRMPVRGIPSPVHLSEAALAMLNAPRLRNMTYPALSDKEGWSELVRKRDERVWAQAEGYVKSLQADGEVRRMAGLPVYVAAPRDTRLVNRQQVLLDLHGGALIFGGGKSLELSAKGMALRTGRVAYSLDYRMPPEHPYPTPLDDCMAFYRAMIAQFQPENIVVSGVSAGGNLAAAMLLRARDEGLPMPAGVMLLTPEIDLTESGDSFHTLMGLDAVLTQPLLPINQLYANGADLAHPYVSPLFGDFTQGFPPALLQAGTRDLFLSNAVLMHRKLRDAGLRAELHIWEGMPHAGFGGISPEDRSVNDELRRFLDSLLI
jgi:acetyl esterase/lipase